MTAPADTAAVPGQRDPEPEIVLRYLVEPAGEAAYVTVRPDHPDAVISRMVGAPFMSDGYEKMICFPVEAFRFHAHAGIEFYYAVCTPKTPDGTLANIPPQVPVATGPDGSSARRYLFARKVVADKLTGEISARHVMVVDHPVEVDGLGEEFTIDMDRCIRSKSGTLGYNVRNHRDDGMRHALVLQSDTLKTTAVATWPQDTLLSMDVAKTELSDMANYLRIRAKRAGTMMSRVKGLGPVFTDPEKQDSVFVSSGTSFETATGRPRPEIVLDHVDKPAIKQFGYTLDHSGTDMALAYRTLARMLDTCVSHPAVPAAVLGVMVLSPSSTGNRNYRIMLYVYCESGAGKTQLGKLPLAAQSPTARGFKDTHVTASMRTGTGTTTTNGLLMDLQYTGGFLPVVDDYVQKQSAEVHKSQRRDGLSVLLGAMEGTAPSKQNWGKAGPEFAKPFQPQGSVLILAEEPVTFGAEDESNLRRLIEIEGPTSKFEDPGGYDSNLIGELYARESGDLMHHAMSDLAVWSLSSPDLVCDVFDATRREIDEQWSADVTHPSVRRAYVIAAAGLRLMGLRAESYGADLSGAVSGAIEALKTAATLQNQKITVQPQDVTAEVRRFIAGALADAKISIVGPPRYTKDGALAEERTDPFYTEPAGGSESADSDTDDSDEEPVQTPDQPYMRSDLGLKKSGSAWVAGGPVVGRIVGPADTGTTSDLGRVWRIWVTRKDLEALARRFTDRDNRARYSVKELRSALLAAGPENVCVGKAGGPKNDRSRVLWIRADWLLSTDEEEE